jgi:inhibitor of cysteine peptidase
MRLFHGTGDKRWVTLLALALALAIAACSLAPNDPGPTATVVPTLPLPSPLPPATELPAAPLPTLVPTPGKPGGVTIGAAHVEEMGLLILESFPVQVNVHVTGWLGDGCTTLDQVTQVQTGNTITVRITTARPTDAICTQQLVGFEKTIALDVAGLPAGTYTVDVNGVIDTFTLSVDNVLP